MWTGLTMGYDIEWTWKTSPSGEMQYTLKDSRVFFLLLPRHDAYEEECMLLQLLQSESDTKL
jgi:hypothetical protein